jgi:hypothetical protein
LGNKAAACASGREVVHRGGQSRAQAPAGRGGSGTRCPGFAGDEAVAWAQYGPPGELPNIHHRKEYEETLDKLPDDRITCIFVDKKYRRKSVTAIALRGAIDLIAQAGGGVMEEYPHNTTDGNKVSVLYNATRSLYEGAGFDYLRPKGKRNCVMRRVVPEELVGGRRRRRAAAARLGQRSECHMNPAPTHARQVRGCPPEDLAPGQA